MKVRALFFGVTIAAWIDAFIAVIVLANRPELPGFWWQFLGMASVWILVSQLSRLTRTAQDRLGGQSAVITLAPAQSRQERQLVALACLLALLASVLFWASQPHAPLQEGGEVEVSQTQ